MAFLFICSPSNLFVQENKDNQNPDKKKIEGYIKDEMKTQQIPGLTYAVVRNGKVIDSGAYGLANIELQAPVTLHTRFALGSIGKTFTATGIMILVKDEMLSLDDPVNKYIDSLPDTWGSITLRHLLNHTSGIRDYIGDFPGYPVIQGRDRKQEYTEAQIIHMAADAPLNFAAGERWAYSNMNFVLLGFIIHKVSGKPLPEFINERIFSPLGMSETRYISVRDIIPGRATGYLLDDNGKITNGIYVSTFFSSTGDMGIITTACDMAKWSIGLNSGKILDKTILNQMWEPAKLSSGMEATGLGGSNYGLGWFLDDHRGYKVRGHGGSFINGYTSDFLYFDDFDLSVIVLTNLNPTDVHWICLNIGGFFVPELSGIDRIKVNVDEEANSVDRVRNFFEELANNSLDTSLATDNFIKRINPVTEIILNQDAPTFISYVSSDRLKDRKVECYGIPIQKINYYRVQFGGETNYFAIYFTAENKIAGMVGY
ncbi:MAG TPA: serine hydrolase domain-containing protein [Ignavibacteria bacterium]|jgi:CubicO group peptidase (beta-lactamase class C family)